MNPNTDASLWFQVEQDIANYLISHLENESISPERAIEIAKYIVHTIPHQLTDEEMQKIIPQLDDRFTELAGIVHKHLGPISDAAQKQQLDNVSLEIRKYIQNKHQS